MVYLELIFNYHRYYNYYLLTLPPILLQKYSYHYYCLYHQKYYRQLLQVPSNQYFGIVADDGVLFYKSV